MISDYHYHIGIWPHMILPPFIKMFHEDGSRKNPEKDVVTYDWDRTIDCKRGPDVEGERAIIIIRSYDLFHYGNE
jgi:hypothetical protein